MIYAVDPTLDLDFGLETASDEKGCVYEFSGV